MVEIQVSELGSRGNKEYRAVRIVSDIRCCWSKGGPRESLVLMRAPGLTGPPASPPTQNFDPFECAVFRFALCGLVYSVREAVPRAGPITRCDRLGL